MSGSGTQVLTGSLLGPGSLNVSSGELILSAADSYSGRDERQRRHARGNVIECIARRQQLDRRRRRNVRL